jgi:hypothetical protein
MLALQRAGGNRAVGEWLRAAKESGARGWLPHDLAMSRPGDASEREADRAADAIVGGADAESASVAAGAPGADSVQRLSESDRAFFAPRFGEALDDVRIHTGDGAARLADRLGARAFTVGRDIVFGAGEYAPGTRRGRHLLAHELAHAQAQARSGSRSIMRKEKGPFDLAVAAAQESVSNVSASATYDETTEIFHKYGFQVLLVPGTRLAASLNEHGLAVAASSIVVVAPTGQRIDVEFVEASYDFRTASFQVTRIETGSDPLNLAGYAREGLEGYLNGVIRPQLPEPLRKKDYSVKSDPDLPGTASALNGIFRGGGGGGLPKLRDARAHVGLTIPEKLPAPATIPGGARPFYPGGSGVGIDVFASGPLQDIRQFNVQINLTLYREIQAPIDDEHELFIARGTVLLLEARASGPSDKPRLESITLYVDSSKARVHDRFDRWASNRESGLIIRPSRESFDRRMRGGLEEGQFGPRPSPRSEFGKNFKAAIEGPLSWLHVTRIDVGRGGKFAFTYRTEVDQARPIAEEQLQRAVPPLFKELILQNEKLIPGFSLREFFGVGSGKDR